jgi:hypothetical protein
LVFIPVLVLLHLGTSGGLGHDDLVDSEDGDGGFGSQTHSPLLGVAMVVDAQRRDFFDFAGQNVDALGGVSIVIGGDHLGDELVGVGAAVFGEDAGEDLEGLGVAAEAVLVEASQLLALCF